MALQLDLGKERNKYSCLNDASSVCFSDEDTYLIYREKSLVAHLSLFRITFFPRTKIKNWLKICKIIYFPTKSPLCIT